MLRALLPLLLPLLLGHDEVRTSRQGALPVPLPREEGVFHFAIFGDRTGGPPEGIEVLAQAVRETNLLAPDLVMTVGDLVQGYNGTAAWLAQAAEYRATMARLEMAWFPVAGNHDVYGDGGPRAREGHHDRDYETHFGPLWYWFPHKNAAFVVLYSDEGDPRTGERGWERPEVNSMSGEQLDWLRRTLGETKPFDHVFVFLHHPRWIRENYPGSNWDEVHEALRAAGNVTAVFAGHIHRERHDGERDGIAYFTLAATGAAIPFDAPGTGYLHHMHLVTVRKERISVASIPVGAVMDPRSMTPERWREVDALRELVPALPVLEIGGDAGGGGEALLRFENPCAAEIEATAEMFADDPGWLFGPDHVHLRVAPSGAGEAPFRWRREAGRAGISLPRASLRFDYLAPDRRVSFPAMEFALPVAVTGVEPPPEAEGALDLHAQGASVALATVVPDGPFTAEGWLRAGDFSGRRAFLARTEKSEFGLFVSEGRPAFLVFLGDAYVAAESPARLAKGRWHHLAGVFDGAEARLYVDGRLQARRAGSGKRRRNGLPLFLGADPDRFGRPGSFLRGHVDEIRLSAGARYASDFDPSPRFEPDAETLLLLHLDGATGPFACDSSPARRSGLLLGDARYSPQGAGAAATDAK